MVSERTDGAVNERLASPAVRSDEMAPPTFQLPPVMLRRRMDRMGPAAVRSPFRSTILAEIAPSDPSVVMLPALTAPSPPRPAIVRLLRETVPKALMLSNLVAPLTAARARVVVW